MCMLILQGIGEKGASHVLQTHSKIFQDVSILLKKLIEM